MYSGESTPVTFKAKKYIVGDVIDWFGKDVTFYDETETEVSIRTTANENAMRRWALQYELHIKGLSPQSLCDGIKEDLKNTMEIYET